MSDQAGETRDGLLAAAAGTVPADGAAAAAGIGDARDYLRAYYRHVAVEELTAAGPQRIAAAAVEHAVFAAVRPQGRALVRVRPGESAAFNPARDVIDIVTDDMPFLVDSVTMTLAAADLTAALVVHPQLRVRRDEVTGALRTVLGLVDGIRPEPGEIAESWTHLELPRMAGGRAQQIVMDLERVLGDVRATHEDTPRMRARALRLADELAIGRPAAGPDPVRSSPQGLAASPDLVAPSDLAAPQDLAEIEALLRWLADGHFTFLGSREYDLISGDGGMALRGVPGTGLGLLRYDKPASASFAALPPQVRARALDPQRLILSKANSRSTVHRPRYLDYVGVKRLDAAGAVTGEYRFVGLYTHLANSESIGGIPVLRRQLARVLAASGLSADSHDGYDMAEILAEYPREELFQTPVADLIEIATGVLRLRERPHTRLFLRKDIYGRYMSCLVYLPRDRYTTKVRLRAIRTLRRALNGAQVDYSVMVGESPVARLHIVVRAERGRTLAAVNPAALELEIAAAVRSWDDDLAAEAASQLGADRGRKLLAAYTEAIPETYKTDVPASAAVSDLARITELRDSAAGTAFELWESEGYVGGVPAEDDLAPGAPAAPRVWRLTIYRTGTPITLTDVLPRLQHIGVEVVDEHPYEFAAAEPFWIYDFGLRVRSAAPGLWAAGPGSGVPAPEPGDGPGGPAAAAASDAATPLAAASDAATPAAAASGAAGDRAPVLLESVRELVEGALSALWRGDIEDDGFNALVLAARLTWRQMVVLRAYAKYLRQVGSAFTQVYIERVLTSNPRVTRLLVRLFESRFDPSRQDGAAERSEAIAEEIRGELDEVASLDEDRILRAYWGLIAATVRTNYFRGRPEQPSPAGARVPDTVLVRHGVSAQQGVSVPRQVPPPRPAAVRAPYLVVKLDAALVPDLPAPRPKFELFVYSPRFEGVHLRFGSVARGGLRWSDRRDDFRTEVLGLAKAQEVKNAVIVPSGAKGGFVCKQLPQGADRDAVAAEVLACYRMFISAMLDVTDNLESGRVVPPSQVLRHDGDDPYLVVAADKGTATFSDTANDIAVGRGYWLGDAFASGGSEGYDHKKMGITARGAWESVRFHFRTLGLNVDTDDFTVMGIGDMSGDVFGNGMLLSRHIKLVGAFDHRHVFLDPAPDPERSFAERQRLFGLARSSWADYQTGLISAGGGVWPRSAKSVPVSAQAREVLGLAADVAALAPDQLISAMLTAPVDLLWNGGVGTYVKATSQSHPDAGDRSNDAVRVDASQLRAQVIGEGGNLGLTQQGRIEFALSGGLVNTDFIDNSAGVDTSDHEVNIKILLDGAAADGELDVADRGRLLQQMTGEVGALVLEHNYQQNRALAAARTQATEMLHVYARYIRKLEREGKLQRALEVLPGAREVAERRSAGAGLTAPEYSVLLAHTKIFAAEEVRHADLPDDPYLLQVLTGYFPTALRERYQKQMINHRLHREIITTAVVNDMVDRSGITFAFRLNEEIGASTPEIAAAWLVARHVFDMPGLWASVEALDGRVDSSAQILAVLEGRKLTERAARWLLHFRRPPFSISATIDFFAAGVLTVAVGLPGLLTGRDLAGFEERRDSFLSRGVPEKLADRIAAMVPAYSAFDIVDIAHGTGRPVEETAEVYFDLADRLQITRLRDRITALARDDRWNTMARNALRDDLYSAHAALARDVLTVTELARPEDRLAAWVQRNDSAVRRANQTLTEIWENDAFTVATLSVAVRAVRTLVATSALPG